MKTNTPEKRLITEERIAQFAAQLREEERSENTVNKYTRDIGKLRDYAADREITKELLLAYRADLQTRDYKVASINSYLVAANRFCEIMQWHGLAVKQLRIQREVFADEKREVDEHDYKRLVATALRIGKIRLAMILVTLAATGIRVSELPYLTLEAARRGRMTVTNKGKTRLVLLPTDLCRQLIHYAKEREIRTGVLFRTSYGNPINRSNLWKEMKALCEKSGVDPTKAFPHNFRHLFARLYNAVNNNIVRPANLLGHASIETTRLYLRTSPREYEGELEQMGVVLRVMG